MRTRTHTHTHTRAEQGRLRVSTVRVIDIHFLIECDAKMSKYCVITLSKQPSLASAVQTQINSALSSPYYQNKQRRKFRCVEHYFHTDKARCSRHIRQSALGGRARPVREIHTAKTTTAAAQRANHLPCAVMDGRMDV